MRKGQGLSLNVIIVAAIVLIVLLVLWFIFTGRIGQFTGGVEDVDLKAARDAQILSAKIVGAGCVMKEGDAGNCNNINNDDCAAVGCSAGSGSNCEAGAPNCRKFTADTCNDNPQSSVCEWKDTFP